MIKNKKKYKDNKRNFKETLESCSESILKPNPKDRRKIAGITLIALVITIVVLVILATVTINFAFGENGLVSMTEDARDIWQEAEKSEQSEMDEATDLLGWYFENTAMTVKDAINQNASYKKNTTIKDDLENEVVIPSGFKLAADSATKIEDGIVIEDKDGNQFVWIPVGEYNVTETINSAGKLTNNLSRRIFTASEVREVNGDDVIDTYFYGEENENSVAKDQIEGFKTSANSNKGYYIGRYEQGTGNVCKAEVDVYTNVTRNQSKTLAEAMYVDNSYVTSELISSYAWDTALNFICQTNEEGYMLATTTNPDYGNIGTSIKELTGAYKSDNYSNIHDFLGNCYEWTTEFRNSGGYPCVSVGGAYNNSDKSAANRSGSSVDTSASDTSFRLQLYINKVEQ